MDTGIRDLSQIREHEDGPSRRVGTILMAALATVGLVFAMGVLLGRSADAEADAGNDPLAALDRATALAEAEAEEGDLEEHDAPIVERDDLSFPTTLTQDYDTRPEVEATVAAAAAELQHPEPIMRMHTGVAAGDVVTENAPPLPIPAEQAMRQHFTAAAAASPEAEALVRTVDSDPMVQAALPAEPPREPASAGHDGLYTLQVVSYQDRAEADVFADGLRAKGHEAFVVSADVDDRGTFYRVRIGPFDNMRDANEYRAAFEATERMNTFVVRRRDEDDDDH